MEHAYVILLSGERNGGFPVRYRLFPLSLPVAMAMVLIASTVSAATQFATPAFMQRWQQDEAKVANFWGPLANARDGQQEPYAGGQAAAICTPDLAACSRAVAANQRTVQYFDKGRMELTTPGSPVTAGLLVVELMTGRIQIGDTAFDQRTPAAIPVVGDPTNTLYYRDIATATYAPPKIGAYTQTVLAVNGGGPLGEPVGGSPSFPPNDPAALITTIDPQTGHGVAQAFDAFRGRVGLDGIGLAVTEPFWTVATVGGQSRLLLAQAFERRVLTYNSANPDPFKVEFGNVGQQYYTWRYGNAGP
jgi:hypothetical protein